MVRVGLPFRALADAMMQDHQGRLADMSKYMSRRTVLRKTAAAVGAMAGQAVFSVPSLLANRSPNARLAVAVIGCGGRGEASLMTAAGETLVAMADVDDARLAAAATKVGRLGIKPKTFFDYRRMFDAVHKDIDAVFVATPDHHHAPASMAAMQLGKHVFCEKPLCHDVHQGADVGRRGPAIQSCHANGQSGSLRRGVPAALRVPLGWGHRGRRGNVQLERLRQRRSRRPSARVACAAGPALGRMAGPCALSRLPRGPAPGLLALLLGFRHRRLGRLGLP